MKSTFSVLFFVKKDKQKINGSYPIFVRITIDGVASRFNSKLDVQPKLWDGKAGKAAGRSAEAVIFSQYTQRTSFNYKDTKCI